VVDVAAADRDVAERAEGAAAAADAVGREADDGEGAEEAGEQVEEDGLRAGCRGVAADRDLDRVDRRPGCRLEQRLVVAVALGRAAAEQTAELVDDDGARGDDGDRGEPGGGPLRAGPAGPAPQGSD
jgi:hypothetical protein